jgi:hypothetical protein
MQIAGITFIVGELEGFRFIETIFPESLDRTRLWAAASSYPTMWDEAKATVTLNDVSQMGRLSIEATGVLRWVLQQNSLRALIIGTSWVTGSNDGAREQITGVLRDVGRSDETIFRQRDEAIAHLRREIARWTEEQR